MSQIKPGPEATGFVVIPPAGGCGIAVQITALQNTVIPPGYSLDPVQVATVQELTASGTLGTQTYATVYILPDPSFANVGDKGSMITYTPQDDPDGLADIRYIQLSKGVFIKY